VSGHVLTFGETMGLFRAAEIGDLADVDAARIATGGADSNVAIGRPCLRLDPRSPFSSAVRVAASRERGLLSSIGRR
jgi:hypothetical protein